MSKTVSQRRAELESDRFISVRNLAYATYKKPDPSGKLGPDGQVLMVPLMTYEETLTDRQVVYNAILDYELAHNLIVPDDASVTPATNVVAMHPGAPVSQPLPPPPGFAPVGQPPAFSPPAVPAAPFIPSAAPAAPATAQQAAAAPAAAPPQSAEGQPRRRRTPGTAVATPPPPPAAAPEAPSFQAPTAPMAPPAAPSFPAAPVSAPGQSFAFSPTPAPAPAPAPAADLGPVAQKVDQLGGAVNSVITGLEEMKKQLAAVQQQNDLLLTALSHLYLVTPQTATTAQQSGKNVGTLGGFKEYLSQYLPR